jgi:hypothetical protein
VSSPYLTVAEFREAESGQYLDAFSDKALQALMEEVSGWCDEVAMQKLQATQDVEDLSLWPSSRRAVWRPDGSIFVMTEFSPIISIDKVELSFDGVTYSTLSWTAKRRTRQSFTVYPTGVSAFPSGSSGAASTWVRFTYTDGYPNAFLTASALALATSISIDDPTGVRPADTMHVYDPTNGNEQVIVAGGYVVGSTTVPLVGALRYAHAAGVRVSELPVAVKNAAVIAADTHINVPGRQQLQVDTSGSAHMTAPTPDQMPTAERMLVRYARAI